MPPRRSKAPTIPAPTRTLVLDNGASTIKAGFVTTPDASNASSITAKLEPPRLIPNVIARDRQRKLYVGSELERCRDFGEVAFRRPVDRGYIVNWEAQREIWDHEFFDDKAPLGCDPAETRLVLAEQPNALPALQANCDQMVFEEFGFASYYRGLGEHTFLPV
jgi:actin-related protein 6